MTLQIRSAKPTDKDQWEPLWQAYCDFYETRVSREVTESTWRRILNADSSIDCVVAEDTQTGKLLGFINYVIHPRTWSVEDTCYLEDLYVDAAARGRGIGKRLCAALEDICHQKNISRLYWLTRESNHTARQLYDQIAVKDDFIRYVKRLKQA